MDVTFVILIYLFPLQPISNTISNSPPWSPFSASIASTIDLTFVFHFSHRSQHLTISVLGTQIRIAVRRCCDIVYVCPPLLTAAAPC